MRDIVAMLLFLALVAVAASFGATFLPGAWYEALAKPSWTPPNAVFGPVWTILYVLIAIAGWLVWRAGDRGPVLALWAVGLVLNGLWSWLFFGRQSIGLALADIALLWLAIVAFIIAAWPRSRWASLLFAPYLAWVSYAMALNFAIWQLNA